MKKEFTAGEAKEIGQRLGIPWQEIPLEEFRMGLGVELEHGMEYPPSNITNDDPLPTGKIAWAHLHEYPDYYSRLKRMEEEAEAFWSAQKTADGRR